MYTLMSLANFLESNTPSHACIYTYQHVCLLLSTYVNLSGELHHKPSWSRLYRLVCINLSLWTCFSRLTFTDLSYMDLSLQTYFCEFRFMFFGLVFPDIFCGLILMNCLRGFVSVDNSLYGF